MHSKLEKPKECNHTQLHTTAVDILFIVLYGNGHVNGEVHMRDLLISSGIYPVKSDTGWESTVTFCTEAHLCTLTTTQTCSSDQIKLQSFS